MKKLFLGLFISVLALFTYNASVDAREAVEITLPKAVVSSNYNNNDNFYVSLERLDDSYPMPSTSSISTIMITGNNDNTWGSIIFTENGDYKYRIYQDRKNLENVNYHNAVYNLTIRVENDKHAVILKKSGSDKKEEAAVFNNTYKNNDEDGNKDDTPSDDPSNKDNNKNNSNNPFRKATNPYTADTIVKYFIISIISILLILIIIIYVRNSKEDD